MRDKRVEIEFTPFCFITKQYARYYIKRSNLKWVMYLKNLA